MEGAQSESHSSHREPAADPHGGNTHGLVGNKALKSHSESKVAPSLKLQCIVESCKALLAVETHKGSEPNPAPEPIPVPRRRALIIWIAQAILSVPMV